MSEMQALPAASTMMLDDLRCPWMSLDLLQPWRKAKPLAAPGTSFNLVVQSNGVFPGSRFPANCVNSVKKKNNKRSDPFSWETNSTNTNRAGENASFRSVENRKPKAIRLWKSSKLLGLQY